MIFGSGIFISIGPGNGLAPVEHQAIAWNSADEPVLSITLETKHVNILRQRQIDRHFAENIFKCIFLNKKFCILIAISL